MYVVISKSKSMREQRGYERVDLHVVTPVERQPSWTDEEALEKTLNDLVNEGDRGDHHDIIQVIWKS